MPRNRHIKYVPCEGIQPLPPEIKTPPCGVVLFMRNVVYGFEPRNRKIAWFEPQAKGAHRAIANMGITIQPLPPEIKTPPCGVFLFTHALINFAQLMGNLYFPLGTNH